ncbi:adhesin protein Mad2 [Moelleriella libera RCEF 2490]|uniref:Adhesin protein Mad2 n=1 Tax=Moelleriella libera RCEF 2490 TaxID=1081109 RepID=A0A168A150_9HYPO|nr:adhesin protein Mad2 [Moelleriella libera RCEF 2490]
MKSAVLAAAAAAVVSAHDARSPLQLDAVVPKLLNFTLCLGLDVQLPLGISIDTDGCPKEPPTGDCTNVWHPPHHVPMDGCDDNGSDEWHYVHPCSCSAEVPHQWTTSTVTQTQVSTIISCAPTVTDCPANGHTATTVIVPATTYVCPVAVTSTTLATVPAKPYTQPAIQPAVQTHPAVTYAPPPVQPAVQPAPQPTVQPVIRPVAQAPPAWTPPPVQAPAPAPVYAPEPTVAPVVAPAPVAAPYPEDTTPVVVVPPPVGTGYGNWTSPPITAGAAQTSQKVGAVVAMGLVAALLL